MKAFIFLIITVLLGIYGCERVPTPPLAKDPVALAQVHNIVWTLGGYEIGTQKKSLSGFEPVRLVFSDSLFWGDDGCNFYGSHYLTQNDSILPTLFSMTEIACSRKIFPLQFLATPFVLSVYETQIFLRSQESRYHFKSDFTMPVAGSQLCQKIWHLVAATDPVVADIQAKGLASSLVLDDLRRFDLKLSWQDSNALVNNHTTGVFGLGDRGTLAFYQQGISSIGIKPSLLAEKILGSGRYQLKDKRLTLINDSEAVQYVFSAD